MIVTIYIQLRQSYDETDEYVAIQTLDLLIFNNPRFCGYFMNKNIIFLCKLNKIILHSLIFLRLKTRL